MGLRPTQGDENQGGAYICDLPPFARNSAVRRMGHPGRVVVGFLLEIDLGCPILA